MGLKGITCCAFQRAPWSHEPEQSSQSIRQDEPTLAAGSGSRDTCPDGNGVGSSTAQVRAERAGNVKVPGDGRVYHIGFTATDANGQSCRGEVLVCVPHDQGARTACVDEGPLYDSTQCAVDSANR